MEKYVYDFAEGNKDMKDLLGGKGANLAEMTNLGLPVPAGFTITSEACQRYLAHGTHVDGLDAEIDRAFGREEGIAAVATLLDERRFAPATLNGIVAVNDDVALGAMEALSRRGIGVPNPVAVVGFDDIEVTAYVGLTTVRQPLVESGHRGARLLLDILAGRAVAPLRELLPLELVVRGSTGPAPA